MKFNLLNKLKSLLLITIFSKYLIWSLFFVLQGRAIELAINRVEYNYLVYTLIWYVGTKLLLMLCDIYQKFIIEKYKIISLKEKWHALFPKKIFRDNDSKDEKLQILFFDYLPKLFDLEVSVVTNNYTLLILVSIVAYLFLHTEFYCGLVALLIIFVLSYFNKNIFINEMSRCQLEADGSKTKIFEWVSQFLKGYKEISKNWNTHEIQNWHDSVYNNYHLSRVSHNYLCLKRDLLSQLLIEIPFLLNTIVVIFGVFYKYISLAEMFVWIGASQFMINTSNSYFENKINKKYRDNLLIQVLEIVDEFSYVELIEPYDKKRSEFQIYEIKLRDQTKNILGALPGIYRINGKNGSGKSTLFNIILGYERKLITSYSNFNQLDRIMDFENIRLIERETIIFNNLPDFSSQVMGPANNDSKKWDEHINKALFILFDQNLAQNWINIFTDLEYKFNLRGNKLLSSGERVILSFMRFLSSWNCNVKMIIVDECEAFLDFDTRKIFELTLQILSKNMAIYMSSHEMYTC